MFSKGHTFKRLSNRLFIEKGRKQTCVQATKIQAHASTVHIHHRKYIPWQNSELQIILVVSIKYAVLVSVLASIFMRFFKNQNDRLHGFLCVSRCRKLLLSHYYTTLSKRNISEYIQSITIFYYIRDNKNCRYLIVNNFWWRYKTVFLRVFLSHQEFKK